MVNGEYRGKKSKKNSNNTNNSQKKNKQKKSKSQKLSKKAEKAAKRALAKIESRTSGKNSTNDTNSRDLIFDEYQSTTTLTTTTTDTITTTTAAAVAAAAASASIITTTTPSLKKTQSATTTTTTKFQHTSRDHNIKELPSQTKQCPCASVKSTTKTNTNEKDSNNFTYLYSYAAAASPSAGIICSSSTADTPPTSPKVKSSSWKRSEKQSTAACPITSSKKSSKTRKRSPNWLKFSANPPNENSNYGPPPPLIDSTSACRPGTLYSDVLFGATNNSSKSTTPRRSTNTTQNTQKPLSEPLKISKSNDFQIIVTDSEIESEQQDIYPTLNDISTINKTTSTRTALTAQCQKPSTTQSVKMKNANAINLIPKIPPLSLHTSKLSKTYKDMHIPLLSNNSRKKSTSFLDTISGKYENDEEIHRKRNSKKLTTFHLDMDEECVDDADDEEEEESSFENLENSSKNQLLSSHLKYLEQNLRILKKSRNLAKSKSTTLPSSNNKILSVDIPKWNYADTDVTADSYPKFLCQFDDERYLKAEKMALLALKLALGNSSQQCRF